METKSKIIIGIIGLLIIGILGGVFVLAAEGDAIGNWDTSASGNLDVRGVTSNGTFVWTTDLTQARIYRYWGNGTYTGTRYDINGSGNFAPYGIVTNGTFFWVTDIVEEEVYRYNMDGTYTSWSFDTSGEGSDTYGITMNATFFWVQQASSNVFRYNMEGTYTSSYIDLIGFATRGVTYFQDFLSFSNSGVDQLFKYWANGTNTGLNYDTGASGNGDPGDLGNNGSYLFVSDDGDSKVYLYEMGVEAAETSKHFFLRDSHLIFKGGHFKLT